MSPNESTTICVIPAGHMMGFEIAGAPAGQGMLDIPWLLGQLRAAGRDPNAQYAASITPDVAAIILAPEGAARLTASLRLLPLLPLRSLVPLRRQLR